MVPSQQPRHKYISTYHEILLTLTGDSFPPWAIRFKVQLILYYLGMLF